MNRFLRKIGMLALMVLLTLGAQGKSKTLQVYSIDVEGGQATLIVTPAKQSLLVDTGWPGFDARDANRIVAAAKAAGVKQLDYVMITHYHRDHVGGVVELAARIKIGTFVDHGPNLEDGDDERADFAAYEKQAASAKRLVVKSGDELPLKGVSVRMLSGAGERISSPLPGAGEANQYCSSEAEAEVDASENARSLGFLLTYGKFRMLDLGDLTKKNELELVCPNNLIGKVDLFVVTHHGFRQSNPKAMVWALSPKAALMDNGARKGGSPEVWQTLHDAPARPDIWQLHYSIEGGKEHNSDAEYIANPKEAPDAGHYLQVDAKSNGNFTVINSGNGQKKSYK